MYEKRMKKKGPSCLTFFSKNVCSKNVPMQLFSRLIILSFTWNFTCHPTVLEDVLRMMSLQMIIFPICFLNIWESANGHSFWSWSAGVFCSLFTSPWPDLSSSSSWIISHRKYSNMQHQSIIIGMPGYLLYKKFSYSFHRILIESLLYVRYLTYARLCCRHLSYIKKLYLKRYNKNYIKKENNPCSHGACILVCGGQ